MFLEILRSSLWQTSGPETQEDIVPLAEIFHRHALLGVVADNFCQMLTNSHSQQSAKCLVYVRRYMAQLVFTHSHIAEGTVKLFEAMRGEGLHPVLLKGDGLAALYPNRCVRACGDIDVYLPQNEFDRGVELIVRLNKEAGDMEAVKQAHQVGDYEYNIDWNGLDVELHKRAGWAGNRFRKRAYRRLAERQLRTENCVPLYISATDGTASLVPKQGFVEVLQPNPQFNVLYVFNHICQHLSNSGIGLRQFCDWALILHHHYGAIDYRQLHDDLRRTGLLKAWQVLGGIVVNQIGLPKDEFPLYNARRAARSQGFVLRSIVEGSNFLTGTRQHRKLKRGVRRAWQGFVDLLGLTRIAAVISLSTAVAAFVENFSSRFRGTVKALFHRC